MGRIVSEHETSSARIRAKLRNPYSWCFCELCGRTTEYATAIEARAVFKCLRKGAVKAVPLTDRIRQEALRQSHEIVARYEQALAGDLGPYEAGRMLVAYCDVRDLRGDWTVEAFRDQVERRTLITEWSKHGELQAAVRLPKQVDGAPKPSRLYCENHNPKRSDDARRAYQRDRRFVVEFEHVQAEIWARDADKLRRWDLEAHAHVRREAYVMLQAMKSPTRLIESLIAHGVTKQSDIARLLGVSRQAVSAGLRRRNGK